MAKKVYALVFTEQRLAWKAEWGKSYAYVEFKKKILLVIDYNEKSMMVDENVCITMMVNPLNVSYC